ncbi:MAG: rRNA maturation RNase YbeY [Clostridia bacterium]|nr:rRNA maturation RNase YbeY [Clostridia bacterium]
MKHTIYITNEQKLIPVTPALRALIKKAITGALKYEEIEDAAEVSVTLVDNARIHELNLEHRDVDRPTDVLSFPMFEDEGLDEDEALGELILGDIVLSLERAKEQAEEYGHSFERECAFLCVHSVLHLLGYDHEISEEEEKEMFARQEAILQELGITR